MRGLKSPRSEIPRAIAIDYNFVGLHLSLSGLTPAQAARIELPFNGGWGNLTSWATVYRALRQMERPKRLTGG